MNSPCASLYEAMPIDRDLAEAKEILEQAKQLILEGKGELAVTLVDRALEKLGSSITALGLRTKSE